MTIVDMRYCTRQLGCLPPQEADTKPRELTLIDTRNPLLGWGHKRTGNQGAQTERAQKILQAVNIDRELSKTKAPAKIRTTIDLVRRLIKRKNPKNFYVLSNLEIKRH